MLYVGHTHCALAHLLLPWLHLWPIRLVYVCCYDNCIVCASLLIGEVFYECTCGVMVYKLQLR